jgi:hypothetical protein
MKTYKKVHKKEEAAKKHEKAIKERHGKATVKPVKGGGFEITYSFPEK